MEPLTARQYQVLEAIKGYMARTGYAPTIQEICDMTGTSSRGGMVDRLRQLERKRFIKRSTGHRGIRLLNAVGQCPCCGGEIKPDA